MLCIHCRYGTEEFYLFPGGGVEIGETLAECAVREMLEETGLRVKVEKIAYINDWIKDRSTNERVLNLFFLGKVVGGKIIPREKDGYL